MTSRLIEQLRVHIRWKIRRDLPEVLQIENESFLEPWSEEEFLRRMRERNCIGMVAELGEKVVGYMVYELHKPKLLVSKFAVHPKYRRNGVGTQMVRKLINKLSSHRRNRIVLDIKDSNLSAHLFLKACGFEAVRVDRGGRDQEDSYHFVYRLKGETSNIVENSNWDENNN